MHIIHKGFRGFRASSSALFGGCLDKNEARNPTRNHTLNVISHSGERPAFFGCRL